MTIFFSTSGRGESTGYGVYSTLLRPVSRRGDTPEIPWLARWVGGSAQGGNECNRTAMLAGSPAALSASRRKNSRNEVLGSGTEVCISVDRVAEGARTRIGRLSISRACAARGSDLPCLVLRVYPASCFAPAAPSAPFASSLSRRTISAVSRMSASLSSSPIAEAIARNRAFNSR